MPHLSKLALSAVIATALAVPVFAGSHAGGPPPAVKARQSHMQLYLHNLIPMVQMIRGSADYDAERASAHAGNIAALSKLNQSSYWAPGTDSDAVAESNALPAIWENIPDVIAKANAMSEAAVALSASAGGGIDALRAGFTPLNNACNACHEDYQKPQE